MNYLANPELVTLFGTLIAFVGTAILAFSLGRVFWELRFAVDAISTTIENFVSGKDVYVFTGLEERISEALTTSKYPMLTGLLLIAISMPVQGYSLYLNSANTDDILDLAKKASQSADANKLAADVLTSDISALQTKFNTLATIISSIQKEVERVMVTYDSKPAELVVALRNLKMRLERTEQGLKEIRKKQLQPNAATPHRRFGC